MALAGAVLAAALAAAPQQESSDLLYGRVETVRGEALVGFLRWGRGGGAWADLLGGYKELPLEYVHQVRRLRAEADPEADRASRSVVYNGVRITWDEDDTELVPDTAQSGVRFGHVSGVVRTGGGARIRLKSGLEVELAPAPGGGPFLDTLRVESGDGAERALSWMEVSTVSFQAAPPGAASWRERLHGTVTVRGGDRYTGYLTLDASRIYTGDTLRLGGGGEVRTLPLAGVESLRWSGGGTLVAALAGGGTASFADVRGGNRSVRVQDLSLGGVQLPLTRVEEIRFHPPDAAAGYDAFDGARPLRGTVSTHDGARYSGWIRWDNDESHTWEVLNGSAAGASFTVELGKVRSIETDTPRRVRVTLLDGRVLLLSGSNDVGTGNKGIVIQLEDGTFRYVDWVQVDHVELDAG